MMKSVWTILTLSVLLISACEEPFDRPKEIQGGQVVIYGRVSNLVNDTYVEVGITRDKTSKPAEVEGATIQLVDLEGGVTEFCEKRLGIYTPVDAEFKGLVGMSYNVRVQLPDGRVYESIPQKILPPTVIDEVRSDFAKKEVIRDTETASILNFVELSIDADLIDISEEKFIRWDLEETFTIIQTVPPGPFPNYVVCFVSQNMDLQQVNLIRSSNFGSPKIENVRLGDRLVDYAFGVKHATEFYQRTLSEETYNYWVDIEKVSTVSGSIFDNPPAPVLGNVVNVEDSDDVVLGYFEATGSSLRRIFTFGNEMEEPQSDPCRYTWFTNRYPTFCRDCLSHPNSSTEFEGWYVSNEEF